VQAVEAKGYGGPEVLEVVELPQPEPIPTEVLVRVEAAGVNPVDWKTRANGPGGVVQLEAPVVLGWDVAGTVEAVGVGVTRFAPGDKVFGMPWFPRLARAYAEYVTAPSRQLARVPDGMDIVHAGAIPLAGLTAWQALAETADVSRGDRVLIHAAAGGVGHLAVQIAKARGAHVIATARAAKHDFLRGLGADELIDYTDVAFEAETGDVDVVLDLVGGEDYGLRSLEVLHPDGLLIEVPSGAAQPVLEAAQEQGKRATGILVEPEGRGLDELAALDLRVEIAETLPLDQAAKAHELLESRRTQGKIVLVP
jgi:NADPH:quinone reductase-like Zn-dependent oxidoreductase